MKQNKTNSSVKSGINKDTHISQLNENQYTHCLNCNTESEAEGYNINNEPSNYLTVQFPTGYKVLGYKKDLLAERTYYFLTNPTTKFSSIGYVSDILEETFNDDEYTSCTECDGINEVGAGLETIIQTPNHTYNEIVEDSCHDLGEGLNFDLNFPIKHIEIKQEKLGTVLYWTDYNNPPRWMNVTDTEYLFTQEVPCEENITVSCFLPYKLLQFPEHTIPQVEAEVVQIGGNLKLGTYEFYVAYCDLFGNEISKYSVPTNPISIFDENNTILEPTQLDALTNFAIRLKINNLDSRFQYYKVVCAERSNVNNQQSVFLEGIHPTTDDTILYTSSGSSNDDLHIANGNASIKRRLEPLELQKVRPFYEKSKGLVASQNRMFQWGLKVREELNLQPVVNLFGAIALKWQTSAAKESLYKSAIATSKYKGFRRDEVQPFGLRFFYKDGDYSSVFPLVGRPSVGTEKDAVSTEDLNRLSLEENTPNCSTTDREQRWQIFNTASVDGFCSDPTADAIEVTEEFTRSCTIENVEIIPANTTTIDVDGSFVDLQTYIEENPDVVIPEITPYLEDTYPEHCLPNFADTCTVPVLVSEENILGKIASSITVGDTLIEGQEYIIFTLDVGDDFTGTGYTADGEYFFATGVQPTTWITTDVQEVDKQTIVYNERPLADYPISAPPKFCSLYKINEEVGGKINDDAFVLSYMPCGETVYVRDYTAQNELCPSATSVQNNNDTTQPGAGLFHNYYGDLNIANLLSSKTASVNTYVEEILFNAGTAGTTDITINGVIYTATFAGTMNATAASFHATHAVAIAASTGGVVTVVGASVFITQPVNGYTTLITTTSGDLDVRLNATGFTSKLHKGALYFKIDKNDRDKMIFEITEFSNCNANDDISEANEVRYTFYTNCGATSPLAGGAIVDTTDGEFIDVDISTFPDTFYVAIDVPIRTQSIEEKPCDATVLPMYIASRTTPPCGCFNVYTRDIEYVTVSITWDSISIDKEETYTSTCTFFIPKVDECDPKPYTNGQFAYWESTEEYPNNSELWDSSTLTINPTDLTALSIDNVTLFETYFKDSLDLDGNYVLKASTDLRCEPIRHFKFPNNNLSPFMLDMGASPFSETIIFPMGIAIDDDVITTMLQVARNNNLITQKELENIAGYEILRGDNSIHKSVIASGLAYDMYKYNRGNKEYFYANYPHNDLGKDLLHYSDSSRRTLIAHPFDGEKNNKFSFISPDLFLTRPALPTEVALSGYQIGNSLGRFADVEGHPKWVILGKKSKDLATRLAIAEVTLETVIKISEMGSNISAWITVGTSSGTSAIGTALQYVYIGLAAASLAVNAFINAGRYRLQWLKTFRDLGVAYNFANYYVSHGYHNTFIKNEDETNYLRGISLKKYMKDDRKNFRDENNGDKYLVNNWLREHAVFLSLGKTDSNAYHYFNYAEEYYKYDNNVEVAEQASKAIASQAGCTLDSDIERNVGSPYMTLKNYIPDQFGTIDSIKWLTTNNRFDIGEDTSCKTLFGGNVCISRFTWKRKLPIFTSNSMGIADRTPFEYEPYRNIGYPRFFCDYEVDGETSLKSAIFPDIDSEYSFDCETGRNGMYVKPPSKFYLFNYGIADFLVESEINCNFRYGRKEPKDNFFPNVGDMVEWTQEKKVSITEPNTFHYNNVYSLPVSNTPFKYLDSSYSKDVWQKRSIQDNAIIYSELDRNENDLTDPWLIYKPLNRYEAFTKYGKLISLKDIESEQLLGRFENQQVLFNAIDNLADRLTPVTNVFGSGAIFQTRPLEFKATDLGFAGTQHTDMVSTPYGHFTVDAKRGKIFMLDQSGRDLQVISETVGKAQSGMKNWFKENLPFKILKYFPDVDIDNKFKDIGLSMGWDSRFDRVFLTKKDYKPKSQEIVFSDGKFYVDEVEIQLTDETYFEPLYWTIAYKVTEGSWVSYYSFKPSYYVNHQDYFQTGQNTTETLWSHPLNNSSFQVFYGQLEPFIVEYPIINQGVNKMLNQISLNIEAKRWQNQWDYSLHKGVGFNKAVIWNTTNNSGVLNLVEQKSMTDVRKYPKTNNDNTQDILYTPYQGRHIFNYFYNRTKNQDSNIPQWIWDSNRVEKVVNSQAVSFYGKKVLERLKGETFLVNLTNDKESKFGITLKNSINTETISE